MPGCPIYNFMLSKWLRALAKSNLKPTPTNGLKSVCFCTFFFVKKMIPLSGFIWELTLRFFLLIPFHSTENILKSTHTFHSGLISTFKHLKIASNYTVFEIKLHFVRQYLQSVFFYFIN